MVHLTPGYIGSQCDRSARHRVSPPFKVGADIICWYFNYRVITPCHSHPYRSGLHVAYPANPPGSIHLAAICGRGWRYYSFKSLISLRYYGLSSNPRSARVEVGGEDARR